MLLANHGFIKMSSNHQICSLVIGEVFSYLWYKKNCNKCLYNIWYSYDIYL